MKPLLSTDVGGLDNSWRSFFIVGGIAAFMVLAFTLADIVISMMPEWRISTVPGTAQVWFAQLQYNPLLGLRNLDLLNVIVPLIGLPMYVALYGAHYRENHAYAVLALIVVVVGVVVFSTNNPALSLLELSKHYSTALTDSQRFTFEAAGAALLAKGSHGSLGAFAGFFLSSVGTLLMCLVMQKGSAFTLATSWIGAVGSVFMIIYTVGTTFLPEYMNLLFMVVMVGGPLMMVWNTMIALRLFQLSRFTSKYAASPTLAK